MNAIIELARKEIREFPVSELTLIERSAARRDELPIQALLETSTVLKWFRGYQLKDQLLDVH